jgi:hypothetical protein
MDADLLADVPGADAIVDADLLADVPGADAIVDADLLADRVAHNRTYSP